MFKIKSLGQNKPDMKPLCSGITFGFKNQELIFEITTEQIAVPLIVKFFLNDDKSKPNLNIEVGNIEENVLPIYFSNVPQNGASGLKSPISIVQLKDGNLLALMFLVEPVFDGDFYKMTYEFYHGFVAPTGGVE